MKSPHITALRVLIVALVVFGLPRTSLAAEVMRAHFINVGQADATLLEFPCGAILIDAGAQDSQHVTRLVNYLTGFFQTRSDLNKTLKSIIITHNHIDHTKALKAVVKGFTVKRYLDNGQLEGLGTANPRWVRANATTEGRQIVVSEISDDDVTSVSPRTGLTNSAIDPLNCTNVDPKIAILSGRLSENPGWPHDEFDNKNNHSLVVRIDFGQASFLFTGDLEEHAIETMVDWYKETDTLDVDVYQVGHHGSHNGTIESLIEAMTPEIAVISMGEWDFGKGTNNRFTTWHYGHPRKAVVKTLTAGIARRRSTSIRIRVAKASKKFSLYTVRKAIYGTGWSGTIKVRATTDGKFRVTLDN
ncbi:MAG: MBL fold metallo-hydrolase [Gammaproteobacteria bacterium]|nr:MBL fold metallo-hydrolase [Gammaproteobacteria bacterium]